MGTRANFYIGKRWIGSIAWDGYPEGINKDLLGSKTEKSFTSQVNKLLRDGTSPDQGWPWPYSTFTFENGKILKEIT